jgi:hypothetical protein
MKRYGLILAIVVILAANAVALMEAARNRSGAPLQTIELTERELQLQSMGEDDSGVSLLLRCQFQDEGNYFDRARLEAVGFNFRSYDGSSEKEIAPMSRIAFVALEYEGAAWEQLQQRMNAKQQDQRRAALATRLVPVDLAKTVQELRSRYPDQAKYLIVKGLIRARFQNGGSADAGGTQPDRIVGYLSEILPSSINVPPPFTKRLAPLKPQPGKELRYSATLQYGRNMEPWISAVTIK